MLAREHRLRLPRVSRLSNALLAALALHGLLFLAHARHAAHAPTPLTAQTSEQLVELEEPPPEEALRQVTSSAGEAEAATRRSTSEAAAHRVANRAPEIDAPSADTAPSADGLADNGDATNAVAANSAQTQPDAPVRKIDLGLDGHFFLGPPSEELPRVHKSAIQQQLEAAIAADDVKHGLARGNALIGALNAAARDKGPVRGEALLSVTVGPDGRLTDLQLLRGSASDWSSVMESFRELATRKRVRVPSGARGLRVTFSVKAKVQLPSGEEVHASVDGPSLVPNGLLLHGTFDVADVGSGPQRLVYAHIVSEEVL